MMSAQDGTREGKATEGMGRAGYYDAHSEYQRSVADTGAALIDRCVAATTLPEAGESYVVADYGCSTRREFHPDGEPGHRRGP